jgi:hypothetical protein
VLNVPQVERVLDFEPGGIAGPPELALDIPLGMGSAPLLHHLKLAGIKKPLFDETAITAIHQGSGGLLRKANHLARGALIAAAAEKCQTVCAEHVRIAATEVF